MIIKKELQRFVEGGLLDTRRSASVFEILMLNELSHINMFNVSHKFDPQNKCSI